MNRRRADTIVAILLGFVLLAGSILGWRAYRRRRAVEQSMGAMMDPSMGAMHGPDPLWYVIGTLLIVGVIGSVYHVVRDELPEPEEANGPESGSPDRSSSVASPSEEDSDTQKGPVNPESDPQARVLDLLPDDERRVLEPVLDSPGVTQIELRDRSNFSKSKVSQTVRSLEARGLLYREQQGRTYRIYPSDDLRQPGT